MLTGDYTWALTVKVGLTLLIIIAVITLIVMVSAIRYEMRSDNAQGGGIALAVACVVVELVVGGVVGLGYVPWAKPWNEYHALNEVVGTVQKADKRLVASGDNGMSERYSIKFADSAEIFGCDDTRCSQAEVGKKLRLLCTREWQYQAVSGWGCRYGQAS